MSQPVKMQLALFDGLTYKRNISASPQFLQTVELYFPDELDDLADVKEDEL
jgi:hypothetical protein